MNIQQLRNNRPWLVRQLADLLHLDYEDVVGRSRKRELCRSRHMIMLWMHERLGLAAMDIGPAFSRDRTTVYHGLERMRNEREIYTDSRHAMNVFFHEADKRFNKLTQR
jgi:chromosomal replication initiation ATPase DnaA